MSRKAIPLRVLVDSASQIDAVELDLTTTARVPTLRLYRDKVEVMQLQLLTAQTPEGVALLDAQVREVVLGSEELSIPSIIGDATAEEGGASADENEPPPATVFGDPEA